MFSVVVGTEFDLLLFGCSHSIDFINFASTHLVSENWKERIHFLFHSEGIFADQKVWTSKWRFFTLWKSSCQSCSQCLWLAGNDGFTGCMENQTRHPCKERKWMILILMNSVVGCLIGRRRNSYVRWLFVPEHGYFSHSVRDYSSSLFPHVFSHNA